MRTIYKLQFPDGKVYIGQTSSKSPCRRWAGGEGYKDQPNVYEAIKKAGWANVQKEILAKVETEDRGRELEEFYIQKYNSMDRGRGYNKARGSGIKGWSEEAKDAVRKANTGEGNPFYGRHCSEEHKEKIRRSRKEMGYDATNKQKVLCVETGIVYESTAEATRQTGVHNFALRRVCYGQRKTAGGYHWQYV